MTSKIILHNGNRVFEIDKKKYYPCAFRSFRPTPANVSLFYRNGIRLFQMQCSGINSTLGIPYSNYGGAWVGDHRFDFSALDRQMEMFQKFAPDGYFMLMVLLDMPDWWIKQHSCDCDSFLHIGESGFVKEWVEEATEYLKAFLEYAESRYGNRVFAYSFSAGQATEWFDSFEDSPRKSEAYRNAVGQPNAHVPTLSEIRNKDLPSLYETDSPAYQYMKFCSSLTPQLILHFASAAQEVLHHEKILGLFFGYSDMPVNWQNQTGTNGYEAVWASEDIDMMFSPASYRNSRLADGVSSYQYTVDSVALHDKLYLHEIDHRTYLSHYPLDNCSMIDRGYDTAEETIRVLRRELCAAAVKDGALWWFDFMGGYYASPELEAELRLEMSVLNRIYEKSHRSISEIAVFVDPMSFLHMKDSTSITVDCVRNNRDALHECGAPYDYFNLKDLPRVNRKQYKMFVFLNALDISEEVKQYIQNELADSTKVWLYAPNLFSGGTEQVCDIKLCPKNDPNAKVNYRGKIFGFTEPTAPMYSVNDSSAEVLASYTDGTVACARKGKQVYLATGNVPPELWRELARQSGVHIYTDKPGALYADSRFIARQTVHETEIELHLPFDCVLEELFDGGVYKTDHCVLKYEA
ncbi:MAG: hypothetical protein PUE85_06040 [Firmicutes bacterium]|nr:hypothetical protein [Bacillota bacterium]